jgi:uncharacterized protein (DUF4415 family)
MKKRSGSSAQGSRAAKKGSATARRKIDFSDIPEMTDKQLASMRRVGRPPVGERPRKAISIRLDERVLEWLRLTAARKEQPYQSLINEILEKAMRRSG